MWYLCWDRDTIKACTSLTYVLDFALGNLCYICPFIGENFFLLREANIGTYWEIYLLEAHENNNDV